MLPMGTGKQRTSSGAKVRVALVVSEDPVELAVQVALAASEDPAEPAVQVGVAPRTKAVTAADQRDLVPRLAAEEELAAAVAETTREPAATEAVIAWAAEE